MSREVRYADTGESLLIKAFGYSPKLRIIDIFLTNPYFDFSKEELSKELGMSKQTIYPKLQGLRGTRRSKGFQKNRASDHVQNKYRAPIS